jgi:hypothetical protein
MRATLGIAILVAAGVAGPRALAQQFVNPNFETGDLSGWTITNTTNGATAIQLVEMFDIDGPAGPLASTLTAKFEVGQVVFIQGINEGIELTQMLAYTGGTQYTISCDWAATRDSASSNNQGGIFTLFAGDTTLAMAAAGPTSMSTPHFGHLEGTFTPAATGQVRVGVRIARPFTAAASLVFQWVDNFNSTGGGGGGGGCYANCDGSTTLPCLNVQDFGCFLNLFAAGDSLANCDGSTTEPVLNVQDFGCFLNLFAAGCTGC